MTCKEMVDFLMDYTNGELPPQQASVFEQHLDRCPPCLEYLRSYRTTVRLGRDVCRAPDGPPPDDVPAGLIEAILDARRSASD